MSNIIKSYLLMVVIAILFVIVGVNVVYRADANTEETITDSITYHCDACYYINMARGQTDFIIPPFKYRVLVPYIAHHMPLQPENALTIITYASLFVCYLLSLIICKRLGFSLFESIIALLAFFTASSQLFNYNDPYLTDAFGLMAIFFMAYALVDTGFATFGIASIVGIFAREGTIFLIPVWLVTKQWRNAISIIVLSCIAFLIPRAIMHSSTDPGTIQYITKTFHSINSTRSITYFIRYLFTTWHFLWFFIPVGIALMPVKQYVRWGTACILLSVGGLFSSLIATDVSRMFSILAPIIVVCIATVFSKLLKSNRVLASIFIVLIAIKFTLGMTALFVQEDFSADLGVEPLQLFYVIGTIFTFYVIFAIRHQIADAVQEKIRSARGISQDNVIDEPPAVTV